MGISIRGVYFMLEEINLKNNSKMSNKWTKIDKVPIYKKARES